MVADFSHLKKLEVTEHSEREFIFDGIIVGYNEDRSPQFPSVWFTPMVRSNKTFLSDSVRMSSEKAEKATKPNPDKVQMLIDRLEQERQNDFEAMARCSLRWGTYAPLDANGKQVEYSKEDCLAFLQNMPEKDSEACRVWIQNPYNFVDPEAYRTGGGVVDATALGNS